MAYADLHFGLAQDALRAGDFAKYGDEMKIVEATLAELSRLTGASPLPSAPLPSAPVITPTSLPAPSASAAP